MEVTQHIRFNAQWSELDSFVSSGNYSSVIVLADTNTAELCWPALVNNCDFVKDAEIIEVPNGEESKSLEIAAQIWSAMLEIGIDRNSLLVNLGGGMITDLGAFIASLYMRGIDFIHIPTTVLAQVDAAIGGKNGIDLNHYKNAIGSFNAAKAIFIYPDLLDTLPERQLRSGLAEMLKHALLDDSQWKVFLGLDHFNLENIKSHIPSSAQVKSDIVESDPYEKAERKKLNLGHTFGHGIESAALANDQDLLHGEAVACGLFLETVLANELGIMNNDTQSEILSVIRSNFSLKHIENVNFEKVWEFMQRDKKNRGKEVRFVLASKPGEVSIDIKVDREQTENAWRKALDLIG